MAYVYIIEFWSLVLENLGRTFLNWNCILDLIFWAYWAMVILNIAIPQTFWFKNCVPILFGYLLQLF